MARRSKTSREEILREALRIVEEEGLGALSLRTLAGNLGVATNALYHYFPDRVALEAEVARAGWRRLLQALKRARVGSPGAKALRRQVKTFIDFTERHSALYRLMLVDRENTPEEIRLRSSYQDFNVVTYGSLVAPDQVDRARRLAWSLVHGMITLHKAGMTPEITDLARDAGDAVIDLLTGIAASRPEVS